VFPAFGVLTMIILRMGGNDDPKQTGDAKGRTFEAPKTWKSSKPSREIHRAALRVEPMNGNDRAAEMVVTALRGSACSIEANLTRWENFLKDKDGNTSKIEREKLQAKYSAVTLR
jgi:hypothetical protein